MMTAEQLKNSILQRALQGKLVPQDNSEDPAQSLLKRFQEKKNALIKAKVIQKDKKMEVVTESEQLFDIPDNWAWTRIGELFQHNTGKALNGSNKEGTILPYITTSNLYWNRFELDNLKEMPFTDAEMEKCTAKKGDLLVCEGGEYGRAAIWNYEYDIRIQNHIHKLRAYGELCTEYFYYLFNFLKSTGQIKGKGIAIQGLSSGALHNLVVPLPPLNEQYRIVGKIHEIIPVWEKYRAASTKLNTLNATFPEMMKKSILQEAVQGKLVPQDPNDEPASVLLEKIAEEKKRLIKEGKIKKQKPLPEITEDEIPFDIPESWEWVRLELVSKSITDGDHQAPPKAVDGVPFLVISNVSTGNIDFAHTRFVSNKYYSALSEDRKANENDILFTVTGSYGIPVKVNTTYKFCFQRHIALIKPLIDTDYLTMVLGSPLIKKQCDATATGTAQKTVGLSVLRNFIIPLPPLNEQKRILERLVEIRKTVATFS